MFTKGNHYGKGRPRIALTKPELLLPAVFAKANVNWQKDLVTLYRRMRERLLSIEERSHLKLLMELMPYMVTKVAIKDFDAVRSTPTGSAEQAKATSELLKQLEQEQHGSPKPPTP